MTKILNIDELVQESPLTIHVDGEDHKMKIPTMEDFIKNLKDLEDLAAAPNMLAETEATIRMIARAFPTLTEDRVRQFPMPAVEQLFAIIREADPDAKVDDKDAEGNGSSAT